MKTDENKDLTTIKNNLNRQPYTTQVNLLNENTINIIIEKQDLTQSMKDIKELMDLDLDYKEREAKIKNDSIANNPVFKIDDKNEKNKRMLNYLLWIIGIIGMGLMMYANPMSAFFLGIIVMLAILTVSFNTRITTTDRRMMTNLVSKLIDFTSNKSNKRK